MFEGHTKGKTFCECGCRRIELQLSCNQRSLPCCHGGRSARSPWPRDRRRRRRSARHSSPLLHAHTPARAKQNTALDRIQAGDVEAARAQLKALAQALGVRDDSAALEPLRTHWHLKVRVCVA
jgi:hypothetical protein